MRADTRFFIARHGETVFNAAARMQGDVLHTPLTRAGFAQADDMGAALRSRLGAGPPLQLWASSAGRALQTLAVIAEHLELDWHSARTDARLDEIGIGEWSGRYYHEVDAENGSIIDRGTGLFTRRPPGGEWYDDIAVRLNGWLQDTAGEAGDRLVVMHGMSSRVLRGLLLGSGPRLGCGTAVAAGLPQGSVVEVEAGAETILMRGGGADSS
ncbi:MAG TPA: histidine phosphatase family protein [Allosphingosinicella sp.]